MAGPPWNRLLDTTNRDRIDRITQAKVDDGCTSIPSAPDSDTPAALRAAGDTVREIARSELMGRDKHGDLRGVAEAQGWLDASADVPDYQAIIAAVGPGRRARSTVSPRINSTELPPQVTPTNRNTIVVSSV